MKDIISMNDMSKEEILEILEIAEKIENSSEEEKLNFLKGKIIYKNGNDEKEHEEVLEEIKDITHLEYEFIN